MNSTKKKTKGGPGRPKKELSPEAQRLANLKAKKTAEKSDRAKRAAGMVDKAVFLGFDTMAQKRPHYTLSPDEKAMLKEANDALLQESGATFLQDPRILIAGTYGLILIPRLIVDYLEYREKRAQKPPRAGAERPAKQDHPGPGEKGPGQDHSGQ